MNSVFRNHRIDYDPDVVISGTGIYHPDETISNEELVNTFNIYAADFNLRNKEKIDSGNLLPIKKQTTAFIEKSSGIKSRYVRDKKNILDPKIMWPYLPERADEKLSLQAEAGVLASRNAMLSANKSNKDINAVILACSHKQRDFPAISIEIQNELNITGFSYDMGISCSSAIFGIQAAYSSIKSGMANSILLVSPEIKSGQFSHRDPGTNFIFGEATAALIIEKRSSCIKESAFQIQDIQLYTEYSNNIRNNRGAYNRCDSEKLFHDDKVFYQNGKKVFKEIASLVPNLIMSQLKNLDIEPHEIKRYWLHQANSSLNRIIIERLIGKNYNSDIAPMVLDKFGNVSSAGAILAFHLFNDDVEIGDNCILSAFGAGYSAGSILLKKIGL